MSEIINEVPTTEGQEPENPQTWETPAQSNPGPARIRDGKFEDLSTRTVNSGDDLAAALERGDIIGSAVSLSGSPLLPEEITLDSLVTVPLDGFPQGVQMQARDAVRHGFLKKTATGYEVPQAEGTQAEADPEAEAQATEEREDRSRVYQPEPLDGEAETEYQKAISGVHPSFAGPIAEAWMKGEEISDKLAEEIASTMPGVQPDEIRSRITKAVNLEAEKAQKVISEKYGVDAEAWFERVREVMPKQLDEAMRLQATQRTTKGYQKLMQEYVANLDQIDPGAALKAVSAMKRPDVTAQVIDGEVIVKAKRGSMPWRQALNAGLIRIRGIK